MTDKASDKAKIYHTDSIVINPQQNNQDNNAFECTSNNISPYELWYDHPDDIHVFDDEYYLCI